MILSISYMPFINSNSEKNEYLYRKTYNIDLKQIQHKNNTKTNTIKR